LNVNLNAIGVFRLSLNKMQMSEMQAGLTGLRQLYQHISYMLWFSS